ARSLVKARDGPEMLRSRPEGELPMTQNGALSKNMRLLGHNDLGGFGNGGEGMAIQLARDGRRVIWLGHESAPKNFTAVDVTDPRKPSVIVQTDRSEERRVGRECKSRLSQHG